MIPILFKVTTLNGESQTINASQITRIVSITKDGVVYTLIRQSDGTHCQTAMSELDICAEIGQRTNVVIGSIIENWRSHLVALAQGIETATSDVATPAEATTGKAKEIHDNGDERDQEEVDYRCDECNEIMPNGQCYAGTITPPRSWCSQICMVRGQAKLKLEEKKA